MRRRTEVIIEIEREIIITKPGNSRTWCSICGKQVQMLTAGEAAQVTKMDESVIYRLTESGELHFAVTSKGMLLICPDSLVVLGTNENARPTPKLLITEGDVSAD